MVKNYKINAAKLIDEVIEDEKFNGTFVISAQNGTMGWLSVCKTIEDLDHFFGTGSYRDSKMNVSRMKMEPNGTFVMDVSGSRGLFADDKVMSEIGIVSKEYLTDDEIKTLYAHLRSINFHNSPLSIERPQGREGKR